MTVAQLIKDTPIWVWILLVFLIKRGIGALSDREMRIEQMFVLPLLFLIWGVYSVIHETEAADVALVVMLIGLIVGMVIGWGLWRSQPRLRNSPSSDLIIRPGTPLTLALIIVLFVVKFILTASLARWPELYHSLRYNLLFGLLSGLLDGVFWGGTLNLVIPWYRDRKRAS